MFILACIEWEGNVNCVRTLMSNDGVRKCGSYVRDEEG
jgi:hypothetical protein